jgi:hypothetical protein
LLFPRSLHDVFPHRLVRFVSSRVIFYRIVLYADCCFVRRIVSGSHRCSRLGCFRRPSHPPTFSNGTISPRHHAPAVSFLSCRIVSLLYNHCCYGERIVSFRTFMMLFRFVDWAPSRWTDLIVRLVFTTRDELATAVYSFQEIRHSWYRLYLSCECVHVKSSPY